MDSYIQSRINKYYAYKNHPLKEEYEEKKKIILSINKSGLFRFRRFLNIMIPGYFVLLFVCAYFDLEYGIFGGFSAPIIMGLGVLNLIIRGIVGSYAGNNDSNNSRIHKRQVEANKRLFEKLQNEYSKKGLEEFTYEDLCSTKCTTDNYCGDPCCGVTGKPLTWEQYNSCKLYGACISCEIFRNAVSAANPNRD